jgi:hypothetical protein
MEAGILKTECDLLASHIGIDGLGWQKIAGLIFVAILGVKTTNWSSRNEHESGTANQNCQINIIMVHAAQKSIWKTLNRGQHELYTIFRLKNEV